MKDLVKPKNKSKSKKKSVQKTKSRKPLGKIEKIISLPIVFEKLTGKKAFWGGNETKRFISWKEKSLRRFRSETGGKTHYRGKLTSTYKNYLKNLITSKGNYIFQ